MDTASAPPNRYRPERYQATRARQAADPLAYASGRAILAALGRYGYLTVPQIVRLLYAPGSRTHANTWLKHLREAGLAHDENWLRVNRDGVNPRVWTFTEKGRKFLRDNDQTELPKIHHRRLPQPWVLDHLIAVNESLITCELLSVRTKGAIELLGLRSDELLHKLPIEIRLAEGKKANVIPDGWVAYGLGETRFSFCLEVDRATEDQEKWRGKIAGYLKALAGDPSPYQERFGLRSTRVLTIVRPKELRQVVSAEKRLADLKTWTELELTAQGKQDWASVFPMTMAAPEELDPRFFFGAKNWIEPFAVNKHRLIPGLLGREDPEIPEDL
jgi:hypothetical protein